MANEYFSDEDNAAELISHMPAEEQKQYKSYGHNTVESVFIDRVFIVYKPTGLNAAGQHREPDVLTLIRCVDFGVDPRAGCHATLRDQKSESEMIVRHVPQKLFTYPIFVSIPPAVTLRWDCRLRDGKAWRSLAFAMLLKTKNKSTFYSAGNVYAEVPAKFKRLFPNVTPGKFSF